MSLMVNIYYTGENGNARKFAEEMTNSGVVDRVRAEKGNKRYTKLKNKRTSGKCKKINRINKKQSISKSTTI